MNFLEQLFHSFSENNLRYIVLRNYEELPYSTGGSDLDILIDKKKAIQFLALLNKTCDKHNGKIVSLIESSVCPRICVMGNNGVKWGVMIDLHLDEITYRGYTIISNKNIWNNSFKYNNITALNSKTDALLGLFKELLNNQNCKEKYFIDFKRHALNEVFLDEIFLDINKSQVTQLLLQSLNIDYSEVEIKRLVNGLNKEFPKKYFYKFNKIYKLKRIFKQPGYTIAFLGTDGSGKSTIIENIIPALKDAFHEAVYYEHMRPNLFPSIARLLGKPGKENGPVTNPHKSPSSGFIGSSFRWGYYLLDYTFGYFLKVYPKKAIRSCVWIFDRYYYDYIIDPKRSRVKLPYNILKFGQLLIPEPDIILCLGTDAKIIHSRKPELELVEVERQVKELKFFCDNHQKAVWVDTGKLIQDSSNDALKEILGAMGKRFKDIKLI